MGEVFITVIVRFSTGVKGLDEILEGGIPKGFLVAVTGEPGTGKTILCLHFINEGIKTGDKGIYVTTEESRESILNQAKQFNMDFDKYLEEGNLIIIDALMGRREDEWSLKSLDPEELVQLVIKAKKKLGYGNARLVIDSMSAFWLDKPATARKYSYFVKKVLSKWNFTILMVSQYAITTSDAFGFGLEHIADGIIRFRRFIREGKLKRCLIVEKMRQTPHSLNMYEVLIEEGKGLTLKPLKGRKEDIALPKSVTNKIIKAKEEKEKEIP